MQPYSFKDLWPPHSTQSISFADPGGLRLRETILPEYGIAHESWASWFRDTSAALLLISFLDGRVSQTPTRFNIDLLIGRLPLVDTPLRATKTTMLSSRKCQDSSFFVADC
jgi:hypothetical protein